MQQTIPAIVKEIKINAPASKIFAALTEPSQLTMWWGQDDMYRCDAMEADLRVGGRWKTTGHGADGKPFTVTGVYREIQPPHALEYTWSYDWSGVDSETVVRYELKDVDGGTLVRLTHSGFTNHEDLKSHDGGWNVVFGWLATYVE